MKANQKMKINMYNNDNRTPVTWRYVKLHPEIQKEIDKMNHAETIMKSTFEDELKQIRRHKKSCCNRRKSKIPDSVKNALEGMALATILLAWVVALIAGFIMITK
jgi:hypothetical protein